LEETLRQNQAQNHESCRLLLERAKKRSSPACTTDDGTRSKIPRKVHVTCPKSLECSLCDEKEGKLCEAMTMKVNEQINRCAKTMTDQKLLAKLSAGDVIAQEMKYHPSSLVALYNQERD